ncbi:MAG: hypothetical protein ACKPKO_60655, partial [Candidatus Fonsibacter sp.]
AIKRWKLIDDDMYEAQYLTKNPKGENALHYAVVIHIRKKVSECNTYIRTRRESDHSLYEIRLME